MAVNNNDNPKYAAAAEELFSAISGWSDSSKRLDDATKRAEALMKNLSGFADSINRTLESSMTFATKEMNKSFGQYTRSFAKAQGEAAMKLNDEKVSVKETLDRLNDAIEDLDSAAKASGKAVDETVKNALIQKRDQAQLHFNNLNNIKSEQAFKIQTINELRKFSINVVTNMANSIVKIYQDAMANAYNKFSSTWENTYGTNTSYNAYSKSEYNAVIDSLQKFIKDKGLTNTVSINDYQEEISNILKGGLTGPLATTVAKYSVLSKEGGISADFSDPAFLKMINKMEREGRDVEQYLSQIMTQSKGVIAEVGNSFGFANGQINTMMDSMYQLSDVTNMSDKALKESITAMTAFNGVLGDTNVDISGIYSNITKYATGGLVGASKQSLLDFSGMTGEQMRNKLESEGMESVLKDTIKGIYNMYDGKEDPEFISKVNEALGGNYDDKDIYSLLNKYDNYEDFEAEFSKTLIAANKTTEQQYLDKLEDYQTEQEKLNNTAENQLSELGQLAKHSVIIETLIGGVITAITTTAMFGKNGLINFGNLNKLRSLFGGFWNGNKTLAEGFKQTAKGRFMQNTGKGATGWTNVSADKVIYTTTGGLKNLFTNGAKGLGAGKAGSIASKITSSKLGSTIFSTGGKALGVAGSLISMGLDAYSGYKEGGTDGALRGALTGSGKAAESGKDVALGAGSAALKGAGIGMIFGPWGAAIGAAVGGLAGLAVGLHDLNDETKKYQRRIEEADNHFKDLNTSIKDLNAANSSYENDLKDYDKLSEYANALEVGKKPTQALLDAFPEYTAYLDENGNVTNKYIAALKENIDIQKQITAIEYDKLVKSKSKDVYGTSSSYETILKDSEKIESEFNSAKDAQTKKLDFERAIQSGKAITYNDAGTGSWFDNSITVDGKTYTIKDIRELYGSDTLTEAQFMGSNLMKDRKITVGNDALKVYNGYGGSDKYSKGTEITGSTLSGTYKVDDFGNSYFGYASNDNINIDTYDKTQSNYDSAYKKKSDNDKKLSQNYASLKNLVKTWNNSWSNQGIAKVISGDLEFLDWAISHDWDINSDSNTEGSFANVLWNYNYALKQMLDSGEDLDSLKSSYISPKTLIDKLSSVQGATLNWEPPFATGLSYVPYDNFRARLHKGEKIVTAADAALERANVKGNSMIPALQNALVSQTDIIIGILEKIYSNMSGKPSGLTGEFSSSVPSIASTI